jgi:predicted DNA-binding protein
MAAHPRPAALAEGSRGRAMSRTTYQLSIDSRLKARLQNINQQTGIPMAKIVNDILEAHLNEYEQRYGVTQRLDLGASDAFPRLRGEDA